MTEATLNPVASRFRVITRTAAVWLYIATLAWAPFPLGGAVAWAAGVQEILIAICWIFWVLGTTGAQDTDQRSRRLVVVPLVLTGLALGWAVVQIMPGVPSAWAHPIWNMASDATGMRVQAVISLNPWRSQGEILKLTSYAMACWLAFRMGRRAETAKLLLNAIIVIGVAYALYAVVFAFADFRQIDVFYSISKRSASVSGAFMSRNNFATFAGLICVAATASLFAKGSEMIVAGRGFRRTVASTIEYCFGRGAPILVAAVLCLAAVVASASRAGFGSTLCGLAALAVASLFVAKHGSSRRWAGAGALAVLLPLVVLIVFSGDTLADRFSHLFDTGTADVVRLSLWDAARRMIADAPWLGLGLGTFQDAYPLYAAQIYPYIMDRAHCDYLEFAAGLGLPAAIAWWAAMAWMLALCIRGIRVRHRNRVYSLIAIAATVLVAVHSCVDFSLQMPAVALLYVTMMGLGAGQSISTRTQA